MFLGTQVNLGFLMNYGPARYKMQSSTISLDFNNF